MKVIDMHCDTIFKLYDDKKNGKENNLLEQDGHLDLMKMKKGDYMLQNFAMFVYLDNTPNPFLKANQLINHYYNEIEKYPHLIRPVYSYDDIEKNNADGVMSSLLALEEGGVVGDDIDMLQHYYRQGVRMITLTWNFENGIAFPNFTRPQQHSDILKTNTKDGLTEFGLKYIKEMERLGMIIDVSHLGDAGFYDVYNNTTKPFVASHSNARSVCPVARNMTDDMILKLASRGGVMGINFCGDFLRYEEQGHAKSYISDMVKHIQYIKELAGIEVIGLGSDFDGINSDLELKDASYYPMLEEALRKANFTEEEIEKIFYKNVLRVYKEVLK